MKYLYFHRTKKNRIPKVVRVKATEKMLYHRFSSLTLANTKKNQNHKSKTSKPDTSQHFLNFVYLSIEKQKSQLVNLVLFVSLHYATNKSNKQDSDSQSKRYLSEQVGINKISTD